MMTEDEKKSAYQAAKERIANRAVIFATAVSALSPVVNAQQTSQNMSDTPSASTEHTIQATPSQTIVMDIAEAENMPVFGSDEWLKSQMLTDRQEHDAAVTTQTAALMTEQEDENYYIYKSYENGQMQKNNQTADEYQLNQYALTNAFAQSCPTAHGKFQIGNWSNINLHTFKNTVELNINGNDQITNNTIILNRQSIDDYFTTRNTPDNPRDFIDHPKIYKASKPKDGKHANSGAYYSATDGSITIFSFSEEEKEAAKQNNETNGTFFSNEFILGNTIAQNNTFFHEQNHKNDLELNGLNSLLTTPLNAARGDRLTETKSCAVEYLAAAQQYTFMKQQGITTIQINGETKPLESIIEMYPGLKEVIQKNGFDANDPQSVRNVVQVASEWWHNNQEQNYIPQHLKQASTAAIFLANHTMSEQLELLKNEDETYQAVSTQMLQNTQIAQNLTVDLSGCRDLLDTMSAATFRCMAYDRQIPTTSYKELSGINNYLESKGLMTDAQKATYMASALDAIAHRSENQDLELKEILLKYNQTMTYADGITESRMDNINMSILQIDGKEYYVTDTMLAQAKERIQQNQSETDFQLNLDPMEMPTISLSSLDLSGKMPEIPLNREEISSDMQQDRQAHDVALQSQTEALISPTSQTLIAENQPTNQNMTPEMIISMQQYTR